MFFLAVNMSVARQSDEITPSDSLFVDDIPKIPASLTKRINQYKNAYGYPLAGWDQSKRELWIKALAGTGTWISRVETPGSSPKPLIYIQAGGVYDIYFQPQSKYLVYNRDTNGDETFQFFLYDITTRESKPITDAKSRSTEPVWSNTGDRIISRRQRR